MTDTDYAHNACRNLISMAKILFSGRDATTVQLDRDIELNKDEMASIIQPESEEG